MELSDKRVINFLLTIQGVGAIFVGIFLAAYLAGLPTTAVLHSELAFRVPLAIFGLLLIFLVLSCLVVAMLRKD